jgi:hypothetical protein
LLSEINADDAKESLVIKLLSLTMEGVSMGRLVLCDDVCLFNEACVKHQQFST